MAASFYTDMNAKIKLMNRDSANLSKEHNDLNEKHEMLIENFDFEKCNPLNSYSY